MRARRWVVERTHAWFNRFRKLLIRWKKKPQNHLALVQFAAAIIVWAVCGGGSGGADVHVEGNADWPSATMPARGALPP